MNAFRMGQSQSILDTEDISQERSNDTQISNTIDTSSKSKIPEYIFSNLLFLKALNKY